MFVVARRSAPVLRTIAPASSLGFQQQRCINHFEKNEKLGRPVSPHVTIYDFPLAAISSVTHRFTGAALCVGLYGMGLGALAGVDVGAAMTGLGHSAIGPLAKLSVTFPLVYHTIGGVRHLYWEKYPEGLNPASQKQASIAVFGLSGALALASLML